MRVSQPISYNALAGDAINNVTTFVENPKSYKGLLDQLEDEFCTEAYYNASESVPARIIGEHYCP